MNIHARPGSLPSASLPVVASPVIRDDVPLDAIPASAWNALAGRSPFCHMHSWLRCTRQDARRRKPVGLRDTSRHGVTAI
jgi:hypothetical protein